MSGFALEALEKKLGTLSGVECDIILNNNQSTMVSILEKKRTSAKLSLHKMFLKAPENIVKAIADFVRGTSRQARSIIRNYVNNSFPAELEDRRLPRLQTVGRVYDLKEIYDQVNAEYFNNALDLKITWYASPKHRPRTSITFGIYYHPTHLVKIHRALDHETVPRCFVEYVMYHEMLHHICLPYVDARGVYRIHTKEYRAREREFRYFAEAKAWEKKFREQWFRKR